MFTLLSSVIGHLRSPCICNQKVPAKSSRGSMYLFILLSFISAHLISRQVVGKAKNVGEDVPCPLDSRHAPVVKTEPVDADNVLQTPPNSSVKTKEKQST